MAKVLITGVTGYIGKRLIPVLIQMGYEIVCSVRDKTRLSLPTAIRKQVEVIEVDFLNEATLNRIPRSIEGAFYLIHSMNSGEEEFEKLEAKAAANFCKALEGTSIKQVIYLSGITNETKLSPHLASRKQVEEVLRKGAFHLTVLRAGIIIGSGSASFEIIRDLSEKLPIMIAPHWVLSKCQPIAIRDILSLLSLSLFRKDTFDKEYDVGGPDVLTYKEMLLGYAEVRQLKRYILTIPVLTPRLSSYWLYFITKVPYGLAQHLVDSMKVDVVCRNNTLIELLGITPIGYKQAISLAFDKIAQNNVVSSWREAVNVSELHPSLYEYIQVPEEGCFKDQQVVAVINERESFDALWKIGGSTGWYYADFLWSLRGGIDRMFGGYGLRRGRKLPNDIEVGDALDFWRVVLADKKRQRLLLYAEMKLPGEAWLEFRIKDGQLYQTATFRPKGVWGRLYWYLSWPLHLFIFKGMANAIANKSQLI